MIERRPLGTGPGPTLAAPDERVRRGRLAAEVAAPVQVVPADEEPAHRAARGPKRRVLGAGGGQQQFQQLVRSPGFRP